MTIKEMVRTFKGLSRKGVESILSRSKEDRCVFSVSIERDSESGIQFKSCIFGIKLEKKDHIIFEEILDYCISDDEAIDYFIRKATKKLDSKRRKSYNE